MIRKRVTTRKGTSYKLFQQGKEVIFKIQEKLVKDGDNENWIGEKIVDIKIVEKDYE